MRIGILGGTFNPVHKGHIVLAERVQRALKLNKVFFVPTKITPLREEEAVINSEDRYQMIKLALENYKQFEISRFEIDKSGVSYTVDTIEFFRDKFGKDTQLFFIAGSDATEELDRWKDFDRICELATFVIAKRPRFPVTEVKKNVIIVDVDTINVSSSQIRKMIKNNEDFKNLVPPKVYQYIFKKGLYK